MIRMETGFGFFLLSLCLNFNICECQSMNMSSSREVDEIKKFIHKNSPFNPLTEKERERKKKKKNSKNIYKLHWLYRRLTYQFMQMKFSVDKPRKSLIGNVQNSLAIQMRRVISSSNKLCDLISRYEHCHVDFSSNFDALTTWDKSHNFSLRLRVIWYQPTVLTSSASMEMQIKLFTRSQNAKSKK